MSIILKVSNSLQPLSVHLANALSNEPLSPFTPHWVVTQTEGMNSWLKQRIALEIGITAHIKFCKPNDLISELYKIAVPKGKSLLTTETIRWVVYSLLDNGEFKSRFPEIAAYYFQNDIKRIALSDELADLFDQYQVYRHDIIGQWNQQYQNSSINDWQQWLWLALKERIGSYYQDRTETALNLLTAIQQDSVKQHIISKLPAVYLFGIAVITPFYLQIYHALSEFMDIHLFLVNPAPEQWWLDDKSEKQIARLLQKKGLTRVNHHSYALGNDLLLNWGALVKESFGLLMEHDEFINQYDTSATVPIATASTLLQKIQSDIYFNAASNDRQPLTDADVQDGSITIQGAYTPVREVEVLYNYILGLIDTQAMSLAPKDIVVLLSDVDLYAPFIHAVFGNAPHKIPYSIADESYTSGINLFSVLQELLIFDQYSFKAEAVLQLLDAPLLRKRFKIADIAPLRTAVRQAGIVFSKDGRMDDETRIVIWNFGLKKIMYGLCISGEPAIEDGMDTFIPLDSVEGNDGLERIRFVYFVKALQRKIEERRQARTVSEWAIYLQELVEDMIVQAGDGEEEDYAKFIQLTSSLVLQDDGVSEKISFEVFRHSFLKRLQVEQKAAAFMKGGITFCSMVPMRSIPFKVVALLGMNFDKFPRKETAISFSLLQYWKPGDRNVKNNDKHLFLETVLSAQSRLYLSYIAVNEKDGAVLPASSLVDELIDYIARGLQLDTDAFKKKWITIHPLYNFSCQYNPNGGLINYLSEDRYKTKIKVPQQQLHKKDFNFDIVPIEQIGLFLQNPPKSYFNKQLNIYYQEEAVLLEDHEVFGVDSLSVWSIQEAFLYKGNDDTLDFYKQAKNKGSLPLHNMGKVVFDKIINDIRLLRDRFHQHINNDARRCVDVALHIGTTQIVGSIDAVFGNRFISVCNSSQQLKYFLKDYIQYLLLVADGHELPFIFIAKYLTDDLIIPTLSISKDAAIALLSQYLAYYKQGLDSYFYFYPALAINDFKILHEEYAVFWQAYEQARDNEHNFVFNDLYLEKAISFGFFSEEHYKMLRQNTLTIFMPIQERFPELFKEIKKDK